MIYDIEPPLRKTMVLFFVIGTPDSMSGSKIGFVNSAIEEVVPEIQDMSSNSADMQIKIAALQFDSGCRWITSSGPIEAEKFHWNMIDASGVTDFGAACRELDKKLSTKEFMKRASGSYAPVVILLSDGEPTDNWQSELDALKRNIWFKSAMKVAIAVGQDANLAVLEQFTGSSEAVLEVHNSKMLKQIIGTSALVIGKGMQAGVEKTKQQYLNDDLKEIREEAATDSSDDEQ